MAPLLRQKCYRRVAGRQASDPAIDFIRGHRVKFICSSGDIFCSRVGRDQALVGTETRGAAYTCFVDRPPVRLLSNLQVSLVFR